MTRVVLFAAVAVVLAGRSLARHLVLGKGIGILAAVAALVAGGIAANEYRWYAFQTSLARAVTPVTGGHGDFACQRLFSNFLDTSGHPGHVTFDADGRAHSPAFLSDTTCSGVKRWLDHPDPADIDGIVAMHTVTHEAVHLSGVMSELQAECTAMAYDSQVWQTLGVPAATADAAVERYRSDVWPRLPAEYYGGGTCPGPATS